MTILVEKYLPTCKQKYLFQNYKQSPQYRSYKEFVPSYLHNRPCSVILHCLDRKTKSTKFSAHAIHDMDTTNGIFEVEKSSDSKQVVNFGVEEQNSMPSCTCKDWQQYHIPCKHFFAVFEHRFKWQWEQLPKSYLQSAYLSSDTDALDKHFDSMMTNKWWTHVILNWKYYVLWYSTCTCMCMSILCTVHVCVMRRTELLIAKI